MILQPCEIVFRASRVDDKQKLLIADPVNDQIVNDTASLVKEKSVLPHADLKLVDVVGKHGVQPFACPASFGNQLSHVRNVEDADTISHSLMFLDNAGVLHRHEPTRRMEPFSRPAARARRKAASFSARLQSCVQARLRGKWRKSMED